MCVCEEQCKLFQTHLRNGIKENQSRKIKTPLKDIFTSEKVEHHPRLLPPRRDVVWKMRLR